LKSRRKGILPWKFKKAVIQDLAQNAFSTNNQNLPSAESVEKARIIKGNWWIIKVAEIIGIKIDL
jgi:hypothetical protein